MQGKEIDKEIDFIAKYYKNGLFNVETALKKIKPALRKVWTWQRVAAISCVVVVIGATAALLIRNSFYSEKNSEIDNSFRNEIPFESISKVIDFDDTPLPVVIEQINHVYNVEVTNIPENVDDYYLSLHYEGNVLDLIDIINEILGTDLKITHP